MIKLDNVSVSYDHLCVLNEFSYDFKAKQITCLFGPSGCGKTTLLNAVAGLISYEGEIYKSSKQSFIFQEDKLLPWLTVYDNISVILKGHINEDEIDNTVKHYLQLVGLIDSSQQYPNQLSGGMKRRVAIARAFAYPSDILLMDEPFKGLDKALKAGIINDFMKLWKEDNRTILLVTHDEDVKAFCHHTLMVKGLPLEINDEI
ncbi:MAG: ATP-binding cassette domain-containing protein [Clostridiales bacterium]|nr:ATP-binding cassette domain-containing protein [Clostridiales bacterium]